MTLKQNIEALVRGELGVEAVKAQLLDDITSSPAQATQALQALHEEHEKGVLTQQYYDELTQFVSNTVAPDSGTKPPPTTDSVANDPGDDGSGPGDADTSMTRLATEYMQDDSEVISVVVDIGMRLRDRFILDEIIGVGGMGTVYRGRDILKIEAQDRNPYVAVKILNDSFKQRPDAFIALQREASRQQRLAHPNIATVYDFDRSGGVMYITMEYLDGRTLDQFIKDEVHNTDGLSFEALLPMLEDLCAALSHAHERGIVHADFKPANCFLTKNNRVKVLDFGIARAMQDPNAAAGDQTLFDPRSIGALTPAYASPEMLTDTEDADPRDDIYALACVTYELLSSKHPFHRIPADQAKANKLKPDRIKHLSRRQNDALARGLAFERQDRTPNAAQFLSELKTQPNKAFSNVVLAGAAIAVLLVLAIVLVPRILAEREFEAVVSQLRDVNPTQVGAGLLALDELEPTERARALQTSRPALLQHIRTQFEAALAGSDATIDFPALTRQLTSISALYPDSAALTELKISYLRRRDGYLNDLSSQFESYLKPEHLLPRSDGQDMQALLERLSYVDPTSPLLSDSRLAGAYASSAEAALEQQDFGNTKTLLATGLKLRPADLTLLDLRDRLQSTEQRIAIAAQLAAAEQQLQLAATNVSALAQLKSLEAPIQDLLQLAPDSQVFTGIGQQLRGTLEPELDSALQSSRLNDITQLLQNTQATWSAVAQLGLVQRMRERELQLMERQDALTKLLRSAAATPSLEAQGQSATALLQGLAAIDENDPRIRSAREELVTEIQQRTNQLSEAGKFPEARAELAKASPFALTPAALANVQSTDDRINQLEQSERTRIIAAQQAVERDRQQTLQQAESQRQQEQLAAQQRAVDNSVAAVDQALGEFTAKVDIPTLERVRSRLANLRRLDANNPRLASGQNELQQVLLAALANNTDTQAALTLLADAQRTLGTSLAFTKLEDQLRNRQRQEAAAIQAGKVSAADKALQQALAPTSTLSDSKARRDAAQALDALRSLVAANSKTAANAERAYVQAHVDAATPLISAKRFSAASEILATASAKAPDNAELTSLTAVLASARTDFRRARAAQEQTAKLEALEQRFRREVRSAELTKATRSLRNYRELSASDNFATTGAPALLADAYANQANRLLRENQLSNALQAIAAGQALAPEQLRWQQLEKRVQNARLQLRILAWFRGSSQRSVATIRQAIASLRRDNTDLTDATGNWIEAATRQLAALRSNRNNYNRFLADAQSLLPSSRELAALRPIAAQPIVANPVEVRPPPPITVVPIAEPTVEPTVEPIIGPIAPATLSLDNIAGRWCAEGLEIQFSADQMQFKISRQTLNYPISRYAYDAKLVQVFWRDKRTGNMVFEFGDFAVNSMTQLRGRRENSSSWQDYNRRLQRCR